MDSGILLCGYVVFSGILLCGYVVFSGILLCDYVVFSGILLCDYVVLLVVFCYVLCVYYGGWRILYRKSLSPYIETHHTGSNRLCSIKLCDSVGTSFLLICVHLPTDFQSYLN